METSRISQSVAMATPDSSPSKGSGKNDGRQRRTHSDQANNNMDIMYGENIRPGAKLIGIDNQWYDITNFIPHHPGGDVIESFIGKDATTVFNAFHERDVLKFRTPVGSYTKQTADVATKAFAELHHYFKEQNYFKSSLRWFAMKSGVAFSLLLTAIILTVYREEWYFHYAGAIFLASFWQQCGFLMHDSMHRHVFQNSKIDTALGTFFGTVCIGINGSWWRQEHYHHHALTNTVDSVSEKCLDPQIVEPVWAQNRKLFPLYKTYIQYLAIKFQHITFLPICVFIGRLGITIDSFKGPTTTPREIIAGSIHWTCVALLLSFLPTWKEVVVFYSLASIFEGVLTIQLLISHYSKPFFEYSDVCESQDWYRMQIECNINIITPVWLDWFHGGLNYHIEHHLYPTMPRHNYRRASVHIRKLCNELGIRYDECGWFEAIRRTLACLKEMSVHFKLDPR